MVRARACVLALLVGACAAPAQWQRPGASPAVVQADMEQCQTQTVAAAGQTTYSTLPAQTLSGAATIPALPVGSEDAGSRQNRAFQQCMRDKGYSASE